MTRFIFCAACSEPVHKGESGWQHDDATCGAACADARGERRIIPLEGRMAFSPIPYDPRVTAEALKRS